MTIIRFLAVRLLVYLAAVAVAYVLAVIGASQHVASSLAGMGVELPLGEQLRMVAADLAGMIDMFLPMVAFGMLIAFLATALLCRWLAHWRVALYALAGATALVTIHLALKLSFDVTPIAVARSTGGLVTQGLAGAFGGLTYAWLHRRLTRS